MAAFLSARLSRYIDPAQIVRTGSCASTGRPRPFHQKRNELTRENVEMGNERSFPLARFLFGSIANAAQSEQLCSDKRAPRIDAFNSHFR